MAGGLADIKAGAAFIELYLKNSELLKGLRQLWNPLTKFGARISTIGGAIGAIGIAAATPLYKMAASFADAGSAIADMAARTGMSAEALSTLGYAAGMTGASLEDVEKGIRSMQKKGMSADQLGAIADRMQAISDPAERTAYALKTLGKDGAALIPMLSGGVAGLNAFRAEAERLGLVMSSEDAAAADELGDAMDRVTGSLKGVAMQVGAALAPAIVSLADVITTVVSGVVQFVRDNRQLVVTVAAVAAAIAGAGAVLVGLGGAIMVAGVALGGIATAITAVGSVISAILSPVGLLVSGIGAAVVAFFKFTSAGQALAAWLGAQFGGLLDFVRGVIGGISDAFAAGDMTLAAHIAWAGVKVAFYSAKDAILGGFEDLKAAGAVAWAGIKLGFTQAVNFIGGIWDTFATGITGVFDSVIVNLRQAWGSVTSWIAKQLLKLWGVIEPVLNSLGLISEQTDIGGAIKIVGEENAKFAQRLDAEKAGRDERRGADMQRREREREARLAEQRRQFDAANKEWATGGARGESPEVAAARAELSRLTSEAAAARAAAEAEKAKPLEQGPEIAGPSGKGSAATTFSSAALQALGQGSRPMEKLVKATEEQRKLTQEQKQIAEQQLQVATAMSGSLLNLNSLLTLTP